MKKLIFLIIAAAITFNSCNKNKESVDSVKPTIDISAADAFPKQCGIIQRGQTVTVRFIVNDNVELGSAGINIHQNFDHHNHGTEVNECVLDPKKEPVKPLMLIENYTIPAGKKSYTIEKQINIPADVDTGDYHFMMQVTDKSGWQNMKGISVKIK